MPPGAALRWPPQGSRVWCGCVRAQKPIPATPARVELEHQQISGVAARTCPVRAVLERIVITSSGVIVACWQATTDGARTSARHAPPRPTPHPPPGVLARRSPPVHARRRRWATRRVGAGGEPALLRQALAEALPDAPPKEAQMVREPAMLHTTLARLLRAPALDGSGQAAVTDAQAVMQAVQQLSDALCGLEATFK